MDPTEKHGSAEIKHLPNAIAVKICYTSWKPLDVIVDEATSTSNVVL